MKLIILCVGWLCSMGFAMQIEPQFDSIIQVSKFVQLIITFYSEILKRKVDLWSFSVSSFSTLCRIRKYK